MIKKVWIMFVNYTKLKISKRLKTQRKLRWVFSFREKIMHCYGNKRSIYILRRIFK